MSQEPFHLVANCSPRECIARLNALVADYSSPVIRNRLEITLLQDGNLHFKISRSIYNLPASRIYRYKGSHSIGRSNYVKVEASGYLVSWADSNSAIVVGEAAVSPKTFLINGLFLLGFAVILLGLTLFFLSQFVICAPLVMLVLGSFTYTTLLQPEAIANKHRRALVTQIRRTLR